MILGFIDFKESINWALFLGEIIMGVCWRFKYIPILSNDAAGAAEIDLIGNIFTIFAILILSFIRKPHLIFNILFVIMYLVLQKQYIMKANNPNDIRTVVHEKANIMTGSNEARAIAITRHTIRISTFDL